MGVQTEPGLMAAFPNIKEECFLMSFSLVIKQHAENEQWLVLASI